VEKVYIGAHLYIPGSKALWWNFLQISQQSIRSGAHKLLRRFLDFSQFTDRNFAKIVAPPGGRHGNYVVHLKEQSLAKKAENRIKINPQNMTHFLFKLCHPLMISA